MLMDLSVIIVNWNTRDLLASCLQSVIDTADDLALEILVVDNASTDGSVEMVQERFPQVSLIQNSENLGFARANNRGIRASHGRYVLLLNSDAQLVPGALSAMVRCLDAEADVGITGVRLMFPDGTPQFLYGRFPNLRGEFRALFGLHRRDLSWWDKLDQPREVDWVAGTCLMARRAMLDQVGLLDERFFMFSEEVDLCFRAARAGWRTCLVPSDPVVHLQAGSTGETASRFLRIYRGKLQYFEKYFDRRQRVALLVLIRLSTVLRLVVYGLASFCRPELAAKRRLWQKILERIGSLSA